MRIEDAGPGFSGSGGRAFRARLIEHARARHDDRRQISGQNQPRKKDQSSVTQADFSKNDLQFCSCRGMEFIPDAYDRSAGRK
jgi:hypothetical protein